MSHFVNSACGVFAQSHFGKRTTKTFFKMVIKLHHLHQLLSPLKFSRPISYVHDLSNKYAIEKRLVYHSQSKNIFSNLALEEWLYENRDLTDTEILLTWQSRPCVVIGRHQNPWLEANVPLMKKENVTFSRRSSGGGAVYHDEGNLNLSFIKSRSHYDRKENLKLVVNALTSKWDIDLRINERDDILLDGFYKISGTAAKVGRTQSYHHFTLLHSVDKDRLGKMLSSPLHNTSSKSTKSMPALVKNLSEASSSMTIELMVDSIAEAFVSQAQTFKTEYVDPQDEQRFPGVKEIRQRLQSWNWLYGKTPTFSYQRQFSISSIMKETLGLEILINVEKGCVSALSLHLNEPQLLELCWQLNNVFEDGFLNMRLSSENITHLLVKFADFSLGGYLNKGSHEQIIAQWVTKCLDVSFQFL